MPATPSGQRNNWLLLCLSMIWGKSYTSRCKQQSKTQTFCSKSSVKRPRRLSFKKPLGKTKHPPSQENTDRPQRKQHKNLRRKQEEGQIAFLSHALQISLSVITRSTQLLAAGTQGFETSPQKDRLRRMRTNAAGFSALSYRRSHLTGQTARLSKLLQTCRAQLSDGTISPWCCFSTKSGSSYTKTWTHSPLFLNVTLLTLINHQHSTTSLSALGIQRRVGANWHFIWSLGSLEKVHHSQSKMCHFAFFTDFSEQRTSAQEAEQTQSRSMEKESPKRMKDKPWVV